MTTHFAVKERDGPLIAKLSHDQALLFFYFGGCRIYFSIRQLETNDLLMNAKKVITIYQTAFQSRKSLQELETECLVFASLSPAALHPDVSFCFAKICFTFEVQGSKICLKQGDKHLTIEFDEQHDPVSVSC